MKICGDTSYCTSLLGSCGQTRCRPCAGENAREYANSTGSTTAPSELKAINPRDPDSPLPRSSTGAAAKGPRLSWADISSFNRATGAVRCNRSLLLLEKLNKL